MATSIDKIIFRDLEKNAFNADGSVIVETIYENKNQDSKKDIVIQATELESKPTSTLKNYVSYKLEREIGDALRTDSILNSPTIPSEYKNQLISFVYNALKNESNQYFTELNSGQTKLIEPFPLFANSNVILNLKKKKNFSTTLGFIVYKISGNVEQKIFIENNSEKTDPIFYYDNQFIFFNDYYESYAATVNLVVRDKFIEIQVKGANSKAEIYKPFFIPNVPSINMYSYTNINNKLLFAFEKISGNEITKANDLELFTDLQKDFFKKTIEQKGSSYESDLIYSISLNSEKYFVVYRVDKKPESYSEIIIDNNIIKKLDIEKLEKSFIDNIIPNKKYYYCFRVQDIQGAYSDASLIYEAEIIDQSGTIYMNQNIFKPEKKVEFIKQLDFENRVRIYPTRAQITVPEELVLYHEVTKEQKLPPKLPKQAKKSKNAETKNKLVGNKTVVIEKVPAFSKEELVSNDSIFDSNKIFKARIQSQNSKKKFDLNINYTIQLIDGIKLLKDTTITKNFDILKTEELI
jgi:hypothetical protein